MSVLAGKCLDVPGGDPKPGNKIWIWDCSGETSQRWQFFSGQLLYLGDVSKCIEVPNGDTTNGNVLALNNCNGGKSQHWGYDAKQKTIYLASSADASKCMDLSGGITAKGTYVEIWDCSNGNPNQMWSATKGQGVTSITEELNAAMASGTKGVYSGGKGVLVRNPMDGYEDKKQWKVVPATFWTNDIYTPSALFPTGWGGWLTGNGDPNCPNGGTNGYYKMTKKCPTDPRTKESGPWNYAALAYVINDKMSEFFPHFDSIQSATWGYGVFYPTDANSVDQRCRYVDAAAGNNGYDCPGGWIPWGKLFTADSTKIGSGGYDAGNPEVTGGGGGGAGCHWTGLGAGSEIDQSNANSGGLNLVRNAHCECEYRLGKGNDGWGAWVDQWVKHGTNVKKLDGWMAGGKAPGHGLDQVACWMNNPRDMIGLQNYMYWKRLSWSNQMAPASSWYVGMPETLRVYWGWNEVPIPIAKARDMSLRQAVVIKLPAALCPGAISNPGGTDTIACLSHGAQQNLEGDIDTWVKLGLMKSGLSALNMRPGSYVVFAREYGIYFTGSEGQDLNWQRYLYCENWVSPTGKWEIKFVPKSASNKYGACYLDVGHGHADNGDSSGSSTDVIV